MHNRILGALKDHEAYKLCIPESSIQEKSTVEIEPSDSDSDTSSASNPEISEREDPLENLSSFDPDYVPTSEFDVNTLCNHQIRGENLEFLQRIIQNTIIPTSWTHVPRKMGNRSHGSLKASDWASLYKSYITFLFLSKQMSTSSQQHPYQNTNQTEKSIFIANALLKNTFHLISAIKIATRWKISTAEINAFSDHWKKFLISNQTLFPKQKSKPNNYYSENIPELRS
ncbi:hypothetical protein O181_061477 [Austropuccinia psidii MF-1]|uniref:Uncharacterized protein n=1 Tax=Austropuccinia psidii MF-1 TaxID=1389203 RepID=A0A9Q3EQI1_9BASI|nr:hypothetical protein [Austropuccinia psidii MF-1]